MPALFRGMLMFVTAAILASPEAMAAGIAAGPSAVPPTRETIKLSDFDALTSAISAAGSLPATLIIDKSTNTSEETVFAENIAVKVEAGCRIDNHHLVVIDGGFTAPFPAARVFTGPGLVTSTDRTGSIGEIYPQWFGADGHDTTDDTGGIQKAVFLAIQNKSTVIVPKGTYMIKTSKGSTSNVNVFGGIKVSGGALKMQLEDATLKAIPNNYPYYSILNITDASDVVISGGRIIGDREMHTGSGEFGYGILVQGSRNVTIRDMLIADCWGDGIMLALPKNGSQINSNISIINVTAKNNRRQGMSVLAAHDLVICQSEFSDTKGTAPQAGIDIEPDTGSDVVRRVTIESCRFNNNAFAGITTGGNIGMSDLAIINNIFNGNPYGINIVAVGPGQVKGIDIAQNKISLPSEYAKRLLGIGIDNGLEVQIRDNEILMDGGPSKSHQEFGVYLTGGIDGCMVSNNIVQDIHHGVFTEDESFSRVSIENNRFIHLNTGFATLRPTRGFRLAGNEFRSLRGVGLDVELIDASIVNNSFSEIQGTAINMRSGSNCVIRGNRIKNCALRGGNSDHLVKASNMENSIIDGNDFDNSLTSRYAIMTLTKAKKPNRVSNNSAPYASNAFLINSGDIQYGNSK